MKHIKYLLTGLAIFIGISIGVLTVLTLAYYVPLLVWGCVLGTLLLGLLYLMGEVYYEA